MRHFGKTATPKRSVIVLANGVFDVAHYGHWLHLKAAREMGDMLIVAVTNDEAARKEKGTGRPIFNEKQRAAFLQGWKCVDQAIIVPSVMMAIASVKPDILVKGPDYRHTMGRDVREYCKRHGISIRFTDDEKFSTTDLISAIRRG